MGGPWVSLPLLAWPALFISLGWNFLEYGLAFQDEAGGPIRGWLIPGVMFVLMGAVPLWLAWGTRSSTTPINARFGMPSPRSVEVAAAGAVVGPTTSGDGDDGDADVVDRLERLSALRRRGDLTNEEFERFKAALLGSVEAGS